MLLADKAFWVGWIVRLDSLCWSLYTLHCSYLDGIAPIRRTLLYVFSLVGINDYLLVLYDRRQQEGIFGH